MWNAGFDKGTVTLAIHAENLVKCKPPLHASEVDRIVDNITKNEPGEVSYDRTPAARPEGLIAANACRPAILEWAYEPLILVGGVSLIHGEAGSGKSFAALDIGLTVARSGPVLYVAGEKGLGIQVQRIPAWLAHNGHPEVQFWLMPHGVNMTKQASVDALLDTVEKMRAEYGDLSLIVFDTFSTMSPGIDQNDAGQVGQIIQAAEVARATGGVECSVLFTHHSARSHGNPRGSTDFEAGPASWGRIEGQKDGEGCLTGVLAVTGKQSDGTPGRASWKAVVVPLRTEDGRIFNALTVERADDALIINDLDITVNRRKVALAAGVLLFNTAPLVAGSDVADTVDGVGRRTCYYALDWWAEQGLLEKGAAGGYELGPNWRSFSSRLGGIWMAGSL